MHKKLFYNYLLRFLLEGFFEIFLSSILNIISVIHIILILYSEYRCNLTHMEILFHLYFLLHFYFFQ